MRVHVLTVMPELLEGPLTHSIVMRARRKGLLDLHVHGLRDFSDDPRRSVDDYAYGPGAGMVLMAPPIFRAVEAIIEEYGPVDEVIYTSPDGERLTQPLANSLSMKESLLIICGHYKGVDQRIRDHLVDREVSIGDYVLSGGELPACVIVDSVARLLPGVLSDETSALSDSFQDGLLAPPTYTRPPEFRGWGVPEVLLSGDHGRIEEWRLAESIARTRRLRPELLPDTPQEDKP